MTAITFAGQLAADGSLTVPKEAVDELGLHPGDAVQIHIETMGEQAKLLEPTALDLAVYEMTHRTPEQIAVAQARAMAVYKPRRNVPAGKTLSDMVSGKWPGKETDAQIFAALEELS